MSPVNSCCPVKCQPNCCPHWSQWEYVQAWSGNQVCSSVGNPVSQQPRVSEKVMISNCIPSGFRKLNSSLPSNENRSVSLATRLWHQAQSQSPSVLAVAVEVRVPRAGVTVPTCGGSLGPAPCPFTAVLYRSTSSTVKPLAIVADRCGPLQRRDARPLMRPQTVEALGIGTAGRIRETVDAGGTL